MTTLTTEIGERPITPTRSLPARWMLAGAGVVFVIIGGVGVVVPGLPTTVFLIIASWCFARSCPWLERRLIRNRFFGPFLHYLEPGVRMPLRARLITMGAMWTAVLISSALALSHNAWISAGIVLAGCVGTIVIWRKGRSCSDGLSPEDPEHRQ